MELLKAAVMGVVEGLTEFLPVSSTGHLIVAGRLLRFDGPAASTFEVFIQLGAILAVAVLYRKRFESLLTFGSGSGVSGKNGFILLGLTTLPALVIGAAAHHAIKQYLFHPITVAAALFLGGLAIVWVESALAGRPGRSGLESITRRDALLIGFFQCLAMWPGMSRAACTILGAMVFGLDRKTSTEYSFLAAVPVMIAASAFDLFKNRAVLSGADIPVFAVGFVVSFIFALVAVRVLLRIVASGTLKPFGWYRLAVAPVIYFFVPR